MSGELTFAEIEQSLSNLPRRSAAVMAVFYTPMLAPAPAVAPLRRHLRRPAGGTDGVGRRRRLLRRRHGLQRPADLLRGQRLSRPAVRVPVQTRGVNLGIFHGQFRRKIGFALMFVAFAGMILLAADIASYGGERLHPRGDAWTSSPSVTGTIFIYFWISRALTRPMARLDHGMHRVAAERLRRAPAGDVGRRDGSRRRAASTRWSRACRSASICATRSASM